MDWKALLGASSLINTGVQGWAAYEGVKASKEANKIANKTLNRNIAKEDQAQANLTASINNVYGVKKKKKQPYISQGV